MGCLEAGGKVAVIAHVELTKSVSGKPGWEVLDVAIQAVTSEFIPVESSHEEEVAVLLAKEKRLFEKPLRYDASKMDVFPDFILLDCLRERYPMEVFGRSDEAYEDREADKRAYYQEHFGGDWWCWKVASGGALLPYLPPRVIPSREALIYPPEAPVFPRICLWRQG